MHRKRHKVADRDGWVCFYCKCDVYCHTCDPSSGKEATVDHRFPRALGGTNRLENLVLACPRCNRLKGDLIIDDMSGIVQIAEARMNAIIERRRGQKQWACVIDPKVLGRRRTRPPTSFSTEWKARRYQEEVLDRLSWTTRVHLCPLCELWHVERMAYSD